MENSKTNSLIMMLPLVIISLFCVRLSIINGWPLLIAAPFIIHGIFVYRLSKILTKKEAVAFSLVQYPFSLLMIFMLFIGSYGLGAIFAVPMVYLINMTVGYLYFRFCKIKKRIYNAFVLFFTLAFTIWSMYGASYQLIALITAP